VLIQIGISLGGNLGDREAALSKAIYELQLNGLNILKTSEMIETSPVGFDSEHLFLNMAVLAETEFEAGALLHLFKAIELGMGRIASGEFSSDRVIDLDLIFYGDQVIKTDELMVPHPRMHERLFVLEPFFEIMPKWRHPVSNQTVEEMRQKLLTSGKL